MSSNRITCSRCGANNFDTVTACWKCSASLGGGAQQTQPTNINFAQPLADQERAPQNQPAFSHAETRMGAPANYSQDNTGSRSMARRAAILLALTIPFIGLPVGWAFMMIEDKKKQEIGRYCATWSMIALFLHLLLMYALTAQTMKMLTPVIDSMVRSGMRGSGGNGGAGGSPDLQGGGQ